MTRQEYLLLFITAKKDNADFDCLTYLHWLGILERFQTSQKALEKNGRAMMWKLGKDFNGKAQKARKVVEQ
jgi:hypothetical protein